MSSSTELESLSGWRSIPDSDQEALLPLVKKALPAAKTGKSLKVYGNILISLLQDPDLQYFSLIFPLIYFGPTGTETAEARQTNSRAGTKRKNDSVDNEKSKLAKSSFDMSTSGALQPCSKEKEMEAQTKELWDLKDDLKKYVTSAELREMLEVNEQSTRGSELDLRDKW